MKLIFNIFSGKGIFASVFFLLFLFSLQGYASSHGSNDEPIDAGKEVIEHVKDSHHWHIVGDITLHLPVILYTNKGFEFFSTAKLDHGHADHTGNYYTYRLANGKIHVIKDGVIDNVATSEIYDFSITKNVFAMLIAIVTLLLIILPVASAYKKRVGKAPKGMQSFLEPIIIFIRDEIAKPNLGHKYSKYLPYLLTIFFFIWINNLFGLLPIFPGGANVTGNIAVTVVLGFLTLLITNISANKHYWKHIFFPNVPKWLYPIIIPVEIIGIVSKPFALIIRLFANIFAGHVIVGSLIFLIFIFKSYAVVPVSVGFAIFIGLLEFLVAVLQAYIFTLLTALFIGQAIDDGHH